MDPSEIRSNRVYEMHDGEKRRVLAVRGNEVMFRRWGQKWPRAACYMFRNDFARFAVRDITDEKPRRRRR